MLAIGLKREFICVGLVVVAAVTAISMSSAAGKWTYGNASATEYVQLPKYCWTTYAEGLKGAEFTIPASCGVGMNHYCYGLLDLLRFKNAKSADERKTHLRNAWKNTDYTMTWIKGAGVSESCPITAHVEGTMRDIELKYKIYGIK